MLIVYSNSENSHITNTNNITNETSIGPTILWSMLKGKKVITNDGKDIGEIKDISDNYIRLEKGSIKKDKVLDSKIYC